MGKTTAIILAAEKSARVRSSVPKVLHEVCGATLLERAKIRFFSVSDRG
jgi:bifunctional N-acetylglucosamine-1-phosphate-uridyltransferase/glucosamine-1-phosphate-acetyltransferase GlmU-like protein